MGMFKIYAQWFKRYWKPVSELDERLLDDCIHDALSDEAAAQPPAGARDRLYTAIHARQPVKSHGMWILDEPLRDPPTSPLSLLYHSDSQRLDRTPEFFRPRNDLRQMLWCSLPPSFMAVATW